MLQVVRSLQNDVHLIIHGIIRRFGTFHLAWVAFGNLNYFFKDREVHFKKRSYEEYSGAVGGIANIV